jgi:hypothetical protein
MVYRVLWLPEMELNSIVAALIQLRHDEIEEG